MKNRGNITQPKDHSNILVPEPKDMEVWDLPDQEFIIGF